MTAPVRPSDLKLDPVELFRARCEARALLWQANEFELHEAVDELQHDAERDGLLERVGQDRVQAIMAAAFAAVCEPEVIEIAEVVLDSIPESTFELLENRNRASDSTVEAVMYALREYGTDALHRGSTRARLAELSNRQIEVVIARLVRMRAKHSTVSERLLLVLAELLP
jgi:hypothetical protein